MRILAGRGFADGDAADLRQVALINETFVHQNLAGANPIGVTIRTVAEPRFPERTYEVIGVVSDSKYSGLREPFQPITFVPIAQHPSLRLWPNMVIRSSGLPDPVIAAVKRAIAELHPSMTTQLRLFETEVRDGLTRERLLAWFAGGFGVLAALLAAIGVYGLLSYLVVRRRHEIAIRLALGAGRARVVRLILRGMGALVAVGLAIGVPIATMAARRAGGLLFGLSPRDPAALVGAIGLLAAIAAFAGLVPAWHASRVDPNTALRCE